MRLGVLDFRFLPLWYSLLFVSYPSSTIYTRIHHTTYYQVVSLSPPARTAHRSGIEQKSTWSPSPSLSAKVNRTALVSLTVPSVRCFGFMQSYADSPPFRSQTSPVLHLIVPSPSDWVPSIRFSTAAPPKLYCIMAAVSEPASPPAAKRARLDPDTQFSTLPPSPQPQANGNGNGDTNGSSHASVIAPPEASSAPSFDTTANKVESKVDDYESDDEDVPEQPTAEAEDHSRQDMYLDTVSL